MNKISQSPNAIFMVRPKHFGYNPETATSNAFQHVEVMNVNEVSLKAQLEFDLFVEKLIGAGIKTYVFDEDNPLTPDAIFPNNWISMHQNSQVVLYPMMAENRRMERREDVLSELEKHFDLDSILDLSIYEDEGKYLEGTGSIVFDYKNKLAFANRSPRTHDDIFYLCCKELGYEPVLFSATDKYGREIYHTNVLMTIADEFAVICTDSIVKEDRERVLGILKDTKKEIIEISIDQMNHFLGNMIQLSNKIGERFLVMSQDAFKHLRSEQKIIINDSCQIISSDISTIEHFGGGSARCMIAGIFLPVKRIN